ncbi:G-protein alpha subunit activating protein gbas-1 [Caenorhabditis elegans]|uniref:G-protein alpha subunit activating protein gbas-1 n=1 Tax=Caenorhabditis elegans TaxID=6239 RepID=GBAS1_CAEEL|nr:G-protein alpha subunit activating protein gbas-1 [Caenorhabditis elegans]Q9TZI4.2 RecName: Full=G-protein alpha subunit activating protein gbas-1 [Caenorhabditis elegans]CCD70880.1 G-protein alpha subunit activating protein gbas-1 [Caenorhabditis elegans]|eukprot:NP_494285.2 Ga Binding and Activating and Spk (SPK) domain containing [Caenorhabditis elegans]
MRSVRSSSRTPKPVKRFVFDEDEDLEEIDLDEVDNADFEREDDEEEVLSEPSESPYTSTPKSSKRVNKTRGTKDFFKKDESLQLFRFVLNECRSQKPGRVGRVAKKRVGVNSMKYWERYKREIQGYRLPKQYRYHYSFYSKCFYKVLGLTPEEKVDLYYACEMPVVTDAEKQWLVEQFHVEFDEFGVIIGSDVCTHWDEEHSDSEDDSGKKEEKAREVSRYTEYHDDMMWKFIVDKISEGAQPIIDKHPIWDEFVKLNEENDVISKKSGRNHYDRFRRILVPNLHFMPYDDFTKAVLYERLEYPIPEEYRKILFTTTGADINESGFIEYLPPSTIHQISPIVPIPCHKSNPKFSQLKEPKDLILWSERKKFTPREDSQIWEFVRRKCVDSAGIFVKNDVLRGRGTLFFKDFRNTERKYESITQRFVVLRKLIMDTDYSLKQKLEIYYAISQPVDEDALDAFKSIACLVLNPDGTIRFAISKSFLIGRISDEPAKLEAENYSYVYDLFIFNETFGTAENPEPLCSVSQNRAEKFMLVSQLVFRFISRFEALEDRRIAWITPNAQVAPKEPVPAPSKKKSAFEAYQSSPQTFDTIQRFSTKRPFFCGDNFQIPPKKPFLAEEDVKLEPMEYENSEQIVENAEIKLEPAEELLDAETVTVEEFLMNSYSTAAPSTSTAPAPPKAPVTAPPAPQKSAQLLGKIDFAIGKMRENFDRFLQFAQQNSADLTVVQRYRYDAQMQQMTEKFTKDVSKVLSGDSIKR